MEEITVRVIHYKNRNLVMRYIDPITGKQHARSTGTTKRREAERIAAKWEAELREGRYHQTSKMTWEEFRELYETQKLASLTDRTAEAASGAFNHIERLVSPKRLANLTPSVLSKFQTDLRQEGLRDTTIAGVLRHLQAGLNWAVKQGYLAKVPLIDKPRRGRGVDKAMRGRPITTEEFERMLLVTPDVRKHEPEKWKRLLRGLWLSGLRLGEALALSWDEDAPITVSLDGKFPKLRICGEAQKSGRDQLLPITPDFAEMLLCVPEDEREGLVFGVEGPTPGVPLSTKRASRYISSIGAKAGVVVNKNDGKYASAHDLRRAFGTRWAKRVMPATLQLLMRHRSIETTLKYYVQQGADDVAESLWNGHSSAMREEGNTLGNTTHFEPKGGAAFENSASDETTTS